MTDKNHPPNKRLTPLLILLFITAITLCIAVKTNASVAEGTQPKQETISETTVPIEKETPVKTETQTPPVQEETNDAEEPEYIEPEPEIESTPVPQEPAHEAVREDPPAPSDPLDGPQGDYGRVSIPSLGYSARVYYTADETLSQRYTDMEDTACLIPWGSQTSLADHRNQGFDCIYNAVPYTTLAYIKRTDGTVETWQCIDASDGSSDGYYLTKDDGTVLTNYYSNNMLMYTCVSNWRDVYITVWEQIA